MQLSDVIAPRVHTKSAKLIDEKNIFCFVVSVHDFQAKLLIEGVFFFFQVKKLTSFFFRKKGIYVVYLIQEKTTYNVYHITKNYSKFNMVSNVWRPRPYQLSHGVYYNIHVIGCVKKTTKNTFKNIIIIYSSQYQLTQRKLVCLASVQKNSCYRVCTQPRL